MAAAHVQVFQGSLNESYNAAAAGKKSYKAAAAAKATTGSAAAVEVAAVKGKKEGRTDGRKSGSVAAALNSQLEAAAAATVLADDGFDRRVDVTGECLAVCSLIRPAFRYVVFLNPGQVCTFPSKQAEI